MYQIILASGSPRRREIMETMGLPCQIVSENVKEETQETVPEEQVKALARLKTQAALPGVRARLGNSDVIIIGADTMVFYQGQALGKPKDEQDAARMLQLLSDQVHEVYTGVSIIIDNQDGRREDISFAVASKVTVRALTREQIMDYIATGEPMDKAGAYAIQGKFGMYIKEISGDYYNIVGFPIAKIYDTLLEYGIDLKKLK